MNQNDDFLTEKQASNTIWLTIFEGMLCQKKATPESGFEEYTSKSKSTLGKVSYVKAFESVKGFIVDIKKEAKETVDSKKYTVLQFTIQSVSGKKAILQVNAKANLVAEFAKRVSSIDFKKPLQIGAFWGTKTQSSVVTFKQDGEPIPSNYTKEKPNGLPQWVKDDITGDWDTRDYWLFLYDLIKKYASPSKLEEVKNLLAASLPSSDDREYSGDALAEIPPDAHDDEIPF